MPVTASRLFAREEPEQSGSLASRRNGKKYETEFAYVKDYAQNQDLPVPSAVSRDQGRSLRHAFVRPTATILATPSGRRRPLILGDLEVTKTHSVCPAEKVPQEFNVLGTQKNPLVEDIMDPYRVHRSLLGPASVPSRSPKEWSGNFAIP